MGCHRDYLGVCERLVSDRQDDQLRAAGMCMQCKSSGNGLWYHRYVTKQQLGAAGGVSLFFFVSFRFVGFMFQTGGWKGEGGADWTFVSRFELCFVGGRLG